MSLGSLAASALALVLALSAVACAAPAGGSSSASESTGATSDEIQGGDAETGEPAVGVTTTSTGYCSATLIAPDVVLTAGHCVVDPVRAFLTTNGGVQATVSHAVKAQATFPGYDNAGGCPNNTLDIGLVKLAAPITGITPKTLGAAPASGTTCTAVGFGRYVAGDQIDAAKKRSATSNVTPAVAPNLEVTAGTGLATHGDSGGPLLCNDVVVGTVSCHNDGDGATHEVEYYAAVSDASAWITQQIAAWSPAVTTTTDDATASN